MTKVMVINDNTPPHVQFEPYKSMKLPDTTTKSDADKFQRWVGC